MLHMNRAYNRVHRIQVRTISRRTLLLLSEVRQKRVLHTLSVFDGRLTSFSRLYLFCEIREPRQCYRAFRSASARPYQNTSLFTGISSDLDPPVAHGKSV